MEVDHVIPRALGGKDAFHNWQLLHRHCHDRKTADRTAVGTNDNRQMIEEPCDLETVKHGFEAERRG